jgi:hypothetical protein
LLVSEQNLAPRTCWSSVQHLICFLCSLATLTFPCATELRRIRICATKGCTWGRRRWPRPWRTSYRRSPSSWQ